MKSLIVYDTWYHNTMKIAESIGRGLGPDADAVDARDTEARRFGDYELVVVGCPTHGGTVTPVMKDYLDAIQDGDLAGKDVAAFDTRVKTAWLKLIGYAGKRIARQLENKGGTLLAEPEGFYVRGTEGPLRDGELERARAWGESLAVRLARAAEGAVV